MKILMTTMGLDIGGVETHILELCTQLTGMGHQVVICSNGGVYQPQIESLGVRHIKIPMHRRSPVLMLKSFFMLRRAIKAERPDIVHAHARIPGFICALVRKTLKFNFVTTCHGVYRAQGLLKYLTSWGDKTVTVSEDINQYLRSVYGIKDEDMFLTINGIDTDKFSPETDASGVRAEWGIPEDAPLTVHVSRLDVENSLAAHQLIDIAPRLSAHVPGAVILIVGGGEVAEELKSRADDVNRVLGRPCVIMTGPRTDVHRIVSAADCFVGVSRAALEAMSAARPTVLAGAQGYMGIFTGEKLNSAIDTNFCCRGFPMPEGDDLLKDVMTLLTAGDDHRAELGEFSRAVVKDHYSVRKMTEDTLNAYRAAQPSRRVVLSGYYGFNNAGDEAILKSVLRTIESREPDAHVTVLSANPADTEKLYGVKAIGRFAPFAVLGALRDCDTFISGGGSLLQDATSTRSLLYYSALMRLASKMGKHVVAYSNGIGPVTKPHNRVRVCKAINGASAVSLRDPRSLEELFDMGVDRKDMAVTADPVFLLSPAEPERAREILRKNSVPEGDFITVSVRSIKKTGDYARSVSRICDEISRRTGFFTLFLCMRPNDDEEAALSVMAGMKTPAFLIPGGLAAEELMAVMAQGKLNLAMRLHALIFAARAGVPSVGFSYDPKTEAYLGMLRQPSAGDVSALDSDKAIAAAMDILRNRDEKCRELMTIRDELIASARDGEKIIFGGIK